MGGRALKGVRGWNYLAAFIRIEIEGKEDFS
jgi:hypothetical protein